jgi:hypothetical protein
MMNSPSARRSAGSALLTATVLIIALAAIMTGIFNLTTSEYVKSRRWRDETHSFYVVEAGMNEAFATLDVQGKDALLALAYPRTFGAGTYSVEVELGEDDPDLMDHRIRLTATGGEGREQAAIEVIARAVPNGKYLYAAFGDDGVLLNSNVVIDSFDSNEGPYPGVQPAGYLGNVGSNQDIELDANVEIYGDAVPGPSGVLIDSDPQTYVSGATSSAEAEVVLEPIEVPVIKASPPLSFSGKKTLGPGSAHYKGITVKAGGNLKLVGPAVIVIDKFDLLSNSNLLIDATGGPVEIYATGDFELHSNSSVTTLSQQAKDVSFYLTADTDAKPAPVVSLKSNTEFIGTIYAPNADLTLDSNFEVFGAVMAESLTLASNATLHFDEDLMYLDGVESDYEQVSWRVLSEREE